MNSLFKPFNSRVPWYIRREAIFGIILLNLFCKKWTFCFRLEMNAPFLRKRCCYMILEKLFVPDTEFITDCHDSLLYTLNSLFDIIRRHLSSKNEGFTVYKINESFNFCTKIEGLISYKNRCHMIMENRTCSGCRVQYR